MVEAGSIKSAPASPAVGGAPVSDAELLVRMARVPFSRWHMRARLVMGSATFFDAFDVLALAFVLPVLKGLWNLTPAQIGWLISIGYLGQFVGALGFGALAERIGRVRTATVAILLMSAMAFACAFAGSFPVLLACRFIQGVGVGGEVPVAAAYINEISPTASRGRFFMLYEMVFPIGLMVTGQVGAWLVPAHGWQAMFLVGAVPGLVIATLVARLPESPRWLMARGRSADAERVVAGLEASTEQRVAAPAAPPGPGPGARTGWRELFSPFYRRRTLVVWGLWFGTYLVANGLNNWLPTLYRSVYGLDLAAALRAASMTNVVQVAITLACALLVDRLGRRSWALACYAAAAGLFVALGAGGAGSVLMVGLLATLAYGLLSSVNVLLYLYTPEIYPTRSRALGTGLATACLRLGSSAGPALIGALVAGGRLAWVFLVFAGICGACLLLATRMIETSGRALEEIAP
ncbi:MAG TPA: MFS transporter [Lacunisphaera sp.]|nr:MFS transporter [Lacunisphaera sp.]